MLEDGNRIFVTGERGDPQNKGRKPLNLDVDLLQKYRRGGLSYRKMALKYAQERGLRISYQTVKRRLKQLAEKKLVGDTK